MKKYFCFYCQKDVEPRSLLKWRFCPFCKRLMKDNGDGFYRVCDICGANMPVDAANCPKCGAGVAGALNKMPEILRKASLDNFFDVVFGIFMTIVTFLILIGILYASFYILLVALIVGAAWFMVMSVRRRL